MKTKLDIKSCIAGASLCAAILFTVGAAKNKPHNEEYNSGDTAKTKRHETTHVYRVPCRLTSGSHDLQIFIATGSRSNPMITIADNDGYPTIKDFYARPVRMRGDDGISVTIRFEAPAKGRELSLNVLQEGMTRTFEVMAFKSDK